MFTFRHTAYLFVVSRIIFVMLSLLPVCPYILSDSSQGCWQLEPWREIPGHCSMMKPRLCVSVYAEPCLPAKFNESIGATNKDWMMLGVCLKVSLTLPELQAHSTVCDAVKLNNELPVTQPVKSGSHQFYDSNLPQKCCGR